MKRDEIIQFMKTNGLKGLALVENETDLLGKLAILSPSDKLNWYTGKVVRLNQSIWGYIKHINGKPTKIAFKENNNDY